MNKFNCEFNNRVLGKHYYIFEQYGKSGICTCGYHDLNVDVDTFNECPQCHTKAIINIRTLSAGRYSTDEILLQYLAFNENEFRVILKKATIAIFCNTIVVDNEPVYKIQEGSLDCKIEDYKDLHFYYQTNKRGRQTLKADFYVQGKKQQLLANTCPNLYGVSFVTPEITQALRPLSIEQYNTSDIWKIYSYYKHGKDMIQKGYTGFKGSVSQLRIVNSLLIKEDTAPLFDKMIEYYHHANPKDSIDYYRFRKMFGVARYYYDDAKYKPEFIKFVLDINKDTVKAVADSIIDLSSIFRFFKTLNFTSQEAEQFLNLAIRQKVSLHSICNSKVIQTAEILKKCNIELDKNIKDVRIFLSKIQMFIAFETYTYMNTKHNVMYNADCKIETLTYENKVTAIYNFISKYRDNVINAFVEFALDKKRYSLDFALLYKHEELVEDCLIMIDNSKNISKIIYKDTIFDNEIDIEEFLNTINNKGLGCIA